MKIISWNINCFNERKSKFEYLKHLLESDDFIVILQEVTLNNYSIIYQYFSDNHSTHSLAYRPLGIYDTKSRELGICIISSKNIPIIHADVVTRALLQERTLLVTLEHNTKRYTILGLHSVTGCDHKKAKSLQFYSFAEAIDSYKPDLVAFDANEPQIDNYDISKMKFFDNKDGGKGAKTFFETMLKNNLVEAYSYCSSLEKENLPFSHIVGRTKKRYDFVFIKPDVFPIKKVLYDYDGAVKSGSDHAAIILEL